MNQAKRTRIIASSCLIGGFVFLIAVWYLVSAILLSQGNSVLPYPHEALRRMVYFLFGGDAPRTWGAIGWTFLRLLIGFVTAFVVASILGSLAGLFPNVKRFLFASVGVAKVIPTAAVVVVLITIFSGPKNRTALSFIPAMLVFLVAFPLIYEAFAKGVEELDESIENALSLDNGKKRFKSLIRVYLPNALPYITLSLAQGLGLSMKVAIMSEALTANGSSNPGVGGLMVLANQIGDVEDIASYALLSLILMLLLDIPFFVLKAKQKKAEGK